MYKKEIDTEIQKLPQDLRKEVLDYIIFLSKNYEKRPNKPEKFKFTWEGGLSELNGETTSVELQHKALEWR